MIETQEPAALDRIAHNIALLAGAINTLAAAVSGEYGGKPIYSGPTSPPAEPQKRGRGRPVKGEDQVPAPTVQAQDTSTTTATLAVVEVDAFAPTSSVPVATLEDVRGALTTLKAASTQEIALSVLKDVGSAANITDLKPENYGKVVQAAKKKALEYAKAAAPAPAEDPWEVPATAPAAKPLTMEDVRAVAVAAGKRTGQDTIQKVVMDHGGKAFNPATGVSGPSMKALPEAQYAAVIAAIQALPTTK